MPQLSVAVGAVQVWTAVQSSASLDNVMSEGIPAMTGSSSSVMVTVKLAAAMLPASSMAV